MRTTVLGFLILVSSSTASAQVGVSSLARTRSGSRPNRITAPIDRSRTRVIAGNLHGFAQPQHDQGAVLPSMRMDDMVLVTKPSAEQQADLDQLLTDQQNPSSPSFHQWLTPEEFGGRFGLTPSDHSKIVTWLTSEGFTVKESGRARNWVAFSGTAGQASAALHTEIHRFLVDGEGHFANTGEPAVPEALAGVVGGFLGLNDFHLKSNARLVKPDFTSGNTHSIVPEDFATIYNLAPLYQAGFDGTGVTIAVVGESEVSLSDLRAFRTRYNLPANDPAYFPYAGFSPGYTSAEFEGDLDLEWASAIAPKAKIIYVYGTSAFTAITTAVNLNIAPIVSNSYGGCEAGFRVSFYRSITQQGNAQGMTFLSASGDSGAAGCDQQGSEPVAARGRAVNFPAVLPEVTGVGGTQFVEGTGTYWATTNSPNLGSALSYIPEAAWNETSRSLGLAATGGGASLFYPKPVWQTGPGVPNDSVRHVPDVAFSAAGHDAYSITYEGSNVSVWGTSASAPSFAGIVALLNQYVVAKNFQAKLGLGNINPQLYRLAQSAPAVFHDTTSQDNIVPCQQGSQDCLSGSFGYPATPGYDMATGLGSVDANALLTQWNTATAGVTVTVTATPTRASTNDSVQLTATVAAATGAGTPTGTVDFSINGLPLGSGALSGGSATVTFPLYLLGPGSGNIYAQYSGDAAFSGGGGFAKIQVVLPATGAAIIPSAPNTVWPLNFPDAQGLTWQTTVTLREIAGVPAIITGFTIDGAAQLLSKYFPSPDIPGSAAVSTNVDFRNISTPSTHTFGFTGVDAAGLTWSRQVSVTYFPVPAYDNFNFMASPLVVTQNTSADPSCQWSVQINADDLGGYQSTFVNLFAGLIPFSATQIVKTFGTFRQDALSGLMGTVCFEGNPAPTGSSYIELDRSDGTIQQVLVSFVGPPANPTNLIATPASMSLAASAPSQTVQSSLYLGTSDSAQSWTATVFPANRTTSWLTLSQYSGTGPVQITLTANGAGFEPGAYRALITLQSPNAVPQVMNVPVMFVLGKSTPGMTISAVNSVATGLPILASGMQASVLGSQLANTSATTAGNPLPFSSDGVSVTVNNLAAPILFRTPNRLDIQIPYEAGAGPAVIGVNNNGQIAGFQFQIGVAAPGIFVDPSGNVAGSSGVKQGGILSTTITGFGEVTNPSILTGFSPTSTSSVPRPVLPVGVTVGGAQAFLQSTGILPGMVGAMSVNFIVPLSVQPGLQPVVVTVAGVPSPAAFVNVLSAQPTIAGITPQVGGQGTNMAASLTGTNFTGASSVKFSGSGVTAVILPKGTDTQMNLSLLIAVDATPGPRSVTVSTSAGSTTSDSLFTIRIPQPVIPAVEQGNVRPGYVIITPDPNSAAPAATATFGTVKGGLLQFQAGVAPAPMTTDAILVAAPAPGVSSNLAIAIANPGNTANTLTVTLRDALGITQGAPTTVALQPQQQQARFWSELFPAGTVGPAFSGSLRLQGTAPFSAMGLSFAGNGFSTLAETVTTSASIPPMTLAAGSTTNTPAAGVIGGNSALIFPQFTMGGGWATEIALLNSGLNIMTGRVDVFDSSGNPMAVSLNGSVQSTFSYSISPNGTLLLAPRDANGQPPF
jgi:uncharacterized protein (TIGR03437 family)